MRQRVGWLLLLVVLLGCRQAPMERFDRLALGLTQAEVEDMLGKPRVRYEQMWEYRLTGGEHGFVAFDRRGRVTAWLREETPRLRGGLAPLTEATCDRLQLGTDTEAVLLLLGEPARRQDGRWHYLAPGGYELILEVSAEGTLTGKSWEQVSEQEPEAEEPPGRPAEAASPREVELEVPSR